ncbi:hypothetical protein IWZ03DRAFT_224684 [Phyllosticta citriasiana]|uniref:Uncharacterized protein n=1 Tax=Phyllosticta citriasiana TaxID=595635 RepID=A0ABR1KH67_9PEZI
MEDLCAGGCRASIAAAWVWRRRQAGSLRAGFERVSRLTAFGTYGSRQASKLSDCLTRRQQGEREREEDGGQCSIFSSPSSTLEKKTSVFHTTTTTHPSQPASQPVSQSSCTSNTSASSYACVAAAAAYLLPTCTSPPPPPPRRSIAHGESDTQALNDELDEGGSRTYTSFTCVERTVAMFLSQTSGLRWCICALTRAVRKSGTRGRPDGRTDGQTCLDGWMDGWMANQVP